MRQVFASEKTKKEAGFDFVIEELEIVTPFGKQALKDREPYFPGEEDELREALDRIGLLVDFAEDNPKTLTKLDVDVFMCLKDVTRSIERSFDEVLSVVEIWEIKSLVLYMNTTRELIEKTKFELPSVYKLGDVTEILDILDPRGDRLDTFYIYEEFSEKLTDLRTRKRNIEKTLRKSQKALRDKVQKEYDIKITPKFECVVSKSDVDKMEKVECIPEMEVCEQDYMCVTFSLKKDEEGYRLAEELLKIQEDIEEEEYEVCRKLSREISKHAELLIDNCDKLGEFEMDLAKARYAIENKCVKPTIVDEHTINFTDARHLKVEDVLRKKGDEYTPISVKLKDGVTCITGANMGGKTISLKLMALMQIMTQYALFLPCKEATIGLSNRVQMLIGDSQSVERGLSSFGSEMEELKNLLDRAQTRSMVLIDEIASGTNPVEGLALTKSLIDFLRDKPYITAITTHFDAVSGDDIVNLQVVGLANVDFTKLNKELKHADRKQRIEIIGKHMDYRLCQIHGGAEIPKDALNVANMLGLNKDIIDRAKEYLV